MISHGNSSLSGQTVLEPSCDSTKLGNQLSQTGLDGANITDLSCVLFGV